jgi:hypothetical protein
MPIQDHETLVEKAKEAINAVFSDQSVSRSTTRESLEDLQSDIEICLDSMDADDDD